MRAELPLGVPRRLAAPLAELLQIVERDVVAGEVEQRVQQHRAVAGRQHEAIAIEPQRRARIVPEVALPQHVRHRCAAQRQPGVARVRLLDRIDRESPDRVDRQRRKVGRHRRADASMVVRCPTHGGSQKPDPVRYLLDVGVWRWEAPDRAPASGCGRPGAPAIQDRWPRRRPRPHPCPQPRTTRPSCSRRSVDQGRRRSDDQLLGRRDRSGSRRDARRRHDHAEVGDVRSDHADRDVDADQGRPAEGASSSSTITPARRAASDRDQDARRSRSTRSSSRCRVAAARRRR